MRTEQTDWHFPYNFNSRIYLSNSNITEIHHISLLFFQSSSTDDKYYIFGRR